MSKYRFHLQKYSLGSKIACPSCERPRCFVKYVDEEGVVSFPNEVGKCDHEISCGYHYTPRDFFRDNPNANIKEERSSDYVQPVKSTHEKEIIVPPSFIPLEYFNASLAHFEKNLCGKTPGRRRTPPERPRPLPRVSPSSCRGNW